MRISDFVPIPLEFKISKSTIINETNKTVYRNLWLENTYYNFCHSANMLNKRSRRFDHAQCYWDYDGTGLANLSKKIASTSN